MRLLIRTDDGKRFPLEVAEEATWSDLVALIMSLVGEKPADIKHGFPSRPIEPTNSEIPIKSLSIRDGDIITVVVSDTKHETKRSSLQMHGNTTEPELVVREIPDDNSCLFNAIGYVLCDKSRSEGMSLRQLVSRLVQDDPSYTEAVLGMPPSVYASWILEPNHWGGGIEMALFSKFFAVEIASIDVASGRLDIFGEGEGYTNRVYILYSGIHYDALALRTGDSETTDITVFGVGDDGVLIKALQLAEMAKTEHRYTDVTKFALKCDVCGTAIVGEREAQSHAMQTLHDRFSEFGNN